jgi:hypothetical protein
MKREAEEALARAWEAANADPNASTPLGADGDLDGRGLDQRPGARGGGVGGDARGADQDG